MIISQEMNENVNENDIWMDLVLIWYDCGLMILTTPYEWMQWKNLNQMKSQSYVHVDQMNESYAQGSLMNNYAW